VCYLPTDCRGWHRRGTHGTLLREGLGLPSRIIVSSMGSNRRVSDEHLPGGDFSSDWRNGGVPVAAGLVCRGLCSWGRFMLFVQSGFCDSVRSCDVVKKQS
jgi:hypothetical protein